MYYQDELNALKKASRYRTRELYRDDILDFASNDYLGLAHNKELHNLSSQTLSKLSINSTKASMLVNGYHQIHKDFEDELCLANGFEDAIVLGSGFNANIALVEALVRKNDELFMDEKYHASGVLATKLEGKKTTFFKHNDVDELDGLLKNSKAKRKIIAIEGIYSMDGDLAKKEIFDLAKKYDALLVVDEAHSSGVIGKNLMGIFDYYELKIEPNHIKMGTLGKAYGSFGAFILASHHIVEYLLNRAKPIIYATSLSLYDTLLAHNALRYMLKNKDELTNKLYERKKIIKDRLGYDIKSMILPINIGDNKRVIKIKDELKSLGFMVGAIRQPTVDSAILRVIPRVANTKDDLLCLCQNLDKILKS
ncbi:MAG: pyridoxal phosphate-dependent aminotransferase family protein [Sulfurimonas sp.]